MDKAKEFWDFAERHKLETPAALAMYILLKDGPMVEKAREVRHTLGKYLERECGSPDPRSHDYSDKRLL